MNTKGVLIQSMRCLSRATSVSEQLHPTCHITHRCTSDRQVGCETEKTDYDDSLVEHVLLHCVFCIDPIDGNDVQRDGTTL